MKIYLFLTALTCLWSAANSRKVVWTLPLDQAKVIYHHQKICLTVKGVENCIKKDKEPGDPQELAKMFSIVHEYESGGDGDDDYAPDSAEIESLHDDAEHEPMNDEEVDHEAGPDGHDEPVGTMGDEGPSGADSRDDNQSAATHSEEAD